MSPEIFMLFVVIGILFLCGKGVDSFVNWAGSNIPFIFGVGLMIFLIIAAGG